MEPLNLVPTVFFREEVGYDRCCSLAPHSAGAASAAEVVVLG